MDSAKRRYVLYIFSFLSFNRTKTQGGKEIFAIFNDDSTIYLDNRMKKSIKTVRNIHRN